MPTTTQQSATIDGVEVSISPGETILHAARRHGLEIPTLCQADGLKPEGGCRMCLVECEGQERPLASCHTALAPGMVIQTQTAELRSLRQTILSLYGETSNRTGFRVAATRHGPFRDYLNQHDLNGASSEPSNANGNHPYLHFEPDACISCRLCLNTCEQIQGQFVYGVGNRGPATQLLLGSEDEFASSPCVACGACVDLCPTGALFDRDRFALESPTVETTHTQSVCGYCGVGCRIDIAAEDGVVKHIDGVDDAAVNHGHLCVKGRYAHAYHHSPERLTRPLLREGDDFREATWEEALSHIASELTRIKDEHGADALGAFTSSRSTNEACYLLQKLFRAVIGTNNVDCCARVCHSSTALALQLVTGTGAASASYTDIDCANAIVIAGANPTEAHPVVGARLKQQALRGTPLVVIDPRRIELAEYADIHLQLMPGTNVALFNGLAKVIFEEGLADLPYLEERTEGTDEIRTFLEALDLQEVSAITNVPVQKIQEAARLIGKCGPSLFVHGLGLSELMQGTASVMTLCNLGMITGSIGKPGAGMLPLRGQNNVQGSADMGSMPTHFTGYQPVNDPEVRARIEPIWGALPAETAGLTSTLILRAAVSGEIRGLWLMGEDVVQSDPHEAEVLKAMEKLDLIVIQDLFFSETARYAHVILPACGCLEQEGTFTNGERRIQHVRPAVPAPGEARPDWLAVCQVAQKLGANWDYDSPADVMDEIARVAPRLFGGVHYDRLGADGLQWPCPSNEHPGTSTVHADGFLRGKGKLVSIDYEASPEHGVEDYPYLLVTGRLLEHYNVGTMTRRTPQSELVEADLLQIHPEDAERESLKTGDRVLLQSRWGEIEVQAELNLGIAPGTLFLSFHFPETHTNRVTGPTLDPQSKCPQYKATAVRLTQAPPQPASGNKMRGVLTN